MKELSIEEKAQRYDEALKLAKDSYNYPSYPGFIRADVVFPELKVSEDEQSKKWILEYLYDGLRKADEQFKGQFKAAIAWLEKVKDFDKQLEQAYKNGDGVQYKRGYDAAMREITCTESEAAAITIRDLQERIDELTHKEVSKKSDGWSDEDESEVAILEAYITSGEWSEAHIDRALGIVEELVNKLKSIN